MTLTNGKLTVNAKAISYTIGPDSHDYGSTTTSRPWRPFPDRGQRRDLSIGSYASTGNTTTSNVGTYAITGTRLQRHGPGEQLHRDADQRHADGQCKAISYTIGNASHDYGSTITWRDLGDEFLTGVNGENLAIGSYASTRQHDHVQRRHLRHHRQGLQRHGPGVATTP